MVKHMHRCMQYYCLQRHQSANAMLFAAASCRDDRGEMSKQVDQNKRLCVQTRAKSCVLFFFPGIIKWKNLIVAFSGELLVVERFVGMVSTLVNAFFYI